MARPSDQSDPSILIDLDPQQGWRLVGLMNII
jgi:hypothetical protein